MKKLLFCFGTRPEAIKMAPIIKEAESSGHTVEVCITGQHRDMIVPFMEFFKIKEDYNLNVMKFNQSLASMTAGILSAMQDILDKSKPDTVIVQGDTTTTFTCALAAFYNKIPVAHVEAGLRTGDIYSPFPEEANRKLVTAIATYFFPPTDASAHNLEKEGITKNVLVTGNTSIDSLRLTQDIISSDKLEADLLKKYPMVSEDKDLILITTHRRENHGEPLDNICQAIREVALNNDVNMVLPVHLNPNVKDVVYKYLGEIDNILLTEPLEYLDFCWLMSKAKIILSDSGGVQEEGPYFKTPILVLRENTERPEGVHSGVSKLVGSNKELIISEVNKLLKDPDYHSSFSTNENPYGTGYASQKIINLIALKDA